MSVEIEIAKIQLPFDGIDDFIQASKAEHYEFVHTMVREWEANILCFDKAGEKLLGAYQDGRIVGLGGISIDQYLDDPMIGRLKHIYVLPAFRKSGIAQTLVKNLLTGSENHFNAIRLRTANPNAATLYESFGFQKVDDSSASHVKELR